MRLGLLPPGAVRAALPVITVVLAIAAGVVLGIEIALLVIAAGALLGVVALLWASVQSLTGEAPITLEEALSLGAPSAEEEQKRAVLRALKDLEFERSVGKISEEDYAELSARYRDEAKRLMQSLDQSSEPARERVDKLVAERLAHEKREKPRGAPKQAKAREGKAVANDAEGSTPPDEAGADGGRGNADQPADESEVSASTPVPREAGGESS
jgi:hypothetical protein